jgi:hypothetical protein
MRIWILAASLVVAAPLAAQDHQHHQQPGQQATTDGTLPAGWQARLDRPNASVANVRFVGMDDGYHVVLGPSGIFYNPTQRAQGRYTVRASFTQNQPAQHPEAYGLFVGGRELDGAEQEYLYFLVRQDGRYLIKRRVGSETPTVREWTEHSAVKRTPAGGTATNELAVDVGPQHLRFLVNGTEVARVDNTPQLNTDGIVGLRINHNLDLHVGPLTVQQGGR